MRKFLSMLLVLTLMFALAVPAFAASHDPDHALSGSTTFASTAGAGETAWSDNNTVAIPVYAKLSKGDAIWGDKVYKVKIEWSATEIAHTYSNSYVWNADLTTPAYVRQGNTFSGSAPAGNLTVTVTNVSNAAVTAKLTETVVKDNEKALVTVTKAPAEVTGAVQSVNNGVVTIKSADTVTRDTADTSGGDALKGAVQTVENALTATYTLTTDGLNYIAGSYNQGKCVKVCEFTVTIGTVA